LPENTNRENCLNGRVLLVIGTNNAGKVREIEATLAGEKVRVVSFADAGGTGDLPEPGSTFVENASAKALEAARRTSHLALADDSGLEVAALGGRPGVLSARYGGPEADDADRCRLLLAEMATVGDRRARFVCVLALATPEKVLATWEGQVEGLIAEAMRGEGGFGYDPIFYYAPAGKTFAEMTAEEKNGVSHRGQAVRQLPDVLRRLGLIRQV
jgi:XTP/dITP diphosphohydrolase